MCKADEKTILSLTFINFSQDDITLTILYSQDESNDRLLRELNAESSLQNVLSVDEERINRHREVKMAGCEEAFEEWDAEILDQLIKVEELALSSSSYASVSNPNPNPNPFQPPTLLPATYFPHQDPQIQRNEPPLLSGSYNPISYSPPRELSQRTNVFDSVSHFSNGIAKCASSSLTVAPNDCASGPDKEAEVELLKVRVH